MIIAVLLSHPVLVALIAEVTHEYLHTFFGRAVIIRPGLRTEALVTLQELLVWSSICETGASHSQILHQAQVFHLMQHDLFVELIWKWKFN